MSEKYFLVMFYLYLEKLNCIQMTTLEQKKKKKTSNQATKKMQIQVLITESNDLIIYSRP